MTGNETGSTETNSERTDPGRQTGPRSRADRADGRRRARSIAGRRGFLRAVGAGTVVGLPLVAGCSGGGGGGGTVTPTEEIKIIQQNVPDTAIIEGMLSKFEEETGITATFEKGNYATVQNKTTTQLRSESSDFDVHIVDVYWLGDFAKGELIDPLDERIDDSDRVKRDLYVDAVWNALSSFDGTSYSVPFFNYMHGMMYRQDVLNNSDLGSRYESETGNTFRVPKSVPEYVDLCKFLTRDTNDDGKTDFYGAAMTGKRSVPINDEWLNYFQGMGGTLIDAEGTVRIGEHEDTAVEALKLYIENIENSAPDAAKGWKFSQAMEVMNKGNAFNQLTYMPLFPVMQGALEKGKLKLADTPGGGPILGGWSWAIPSNVSEARKKAAWEFIQWVESPEIRKQRALEGGIPTCNDVLEDQEVLDSNPAMYENLPAVFEGAKPLPKHPGGTAAVQALGTELSRAVSGSKKPEKAISDAISRVKDEMS